MSRVNQMNSRKTIIRVRKENNFVIVSRFPLEDGRLSWEARGLYSFLLAKPDNWTISLTGLTNSSPSGYDKAKRILKELIKFKYVHKEERRGENGQFDLPLYTIYELPYDGHFTGGENPSTVKPLPVNPDMDKPSMANQLLIKKQVNKETDSITTTTNSESLFWPKGLSEQVRLSIDKLIVGTPELDAQLLLDELGVTCSPLSNP